MTEQQLAARLARDLGSLATDAEWSTTPTTDQAQGHYTDPIADAMEEAGLDDLSEATAAQLKTIKRQALLLCLNRLELWAASLVDIEAGPRSEKLSQLRGNIADVRDSGAAGARTARGATLPGRRYLDWSAKEGDGEEEEDV